MSARTFFPVSAAALLASTISGCMSLSGFDASSSFSCKAPDGVLCESMSGIYANAQQNNLPGQQSQHAMDFPASVDSAQDNDLLILTRPVSSGTPIRSAPKVLRIWLAPWEDSDGDLHDQSYLYMTVDTGHWLVEHQRRLIQERYKPLYAAPTAQTHATPAGEETRPDQTTVTTGTVQSRPTGPEAAAMIEGIRTPAEPGQP